jgi:RNA polymerase sigma-70 factor (ECF subfamily)
LPDVRGYYQQYFPRVFAYIYGRTRDTRATEDLASEAFERAFAGAYTPDEEAFAIRLFTTARDLLVSHLRAQSRAGALPQDEVEEAVLKSTDLTRILGHLRRFPQREQDIIALKFDAELTNGQIAQVVGLSEGKVGVVLYRTLRKLRKALEREG